MLKSKGFSLIEILVLVAIGGIVAAIVLPRILEQSGPSCEEQGGTIALVYNSYYGTTDRVCVPAGKQLFVQ